jgi:hypothetical protein
LIPESWPDSEVLAVKESYFKRMWGNHEIIYREEGFEEAWNQRTMLLG